MITTLINLIIYILIIGILLWILQYVINNVPALAPFRQMAQVVLVVIGGLLLIMVLLSLLGSGVNLPRFGSLRDLLTYA
jgi:hypothetical protein